MGSASELSTLAMVTLHTGLRTLRSLWHTRNLTHAQWYTRAMVHTRNGTVQGPPFQLRPALDSLLSILVALDCLDGRVQGAARRARAWQWRGEARCATCLFVCGAIFCRPAKRRAYILYGIFAVALVARAVPCRGDGDTGGDAALSR